MLLASSDRDCFRFLGKKFFKLVLDSNEIETDLKERVKLIKERMGENAPSDSGGA